jgi:UDP-N-acetylmuramyl pentapeptide phosphotransferase/UDP-N-acetylglucosamine-1-phosphate transferase
VGELEPAVAGALVASATTLAIMPLVVRWADANGILDEPGVRSSHERATPRLGGVAVAIGLVAGIATAVLINADRQTTEALRIVLLTALVVGSVGMADDLLRGTPVLVRLTGQVVGASLTVGWWVADEESLAVAAVAILAVAVVVNVFNFMDGANGVAGFTAVVVGTNLALVGLLEDYQVLVIAGTVLAGAAIGFLPFNLPRARVFLGDVGSYCLGAWIATMFVIGVVGGLPAESVGAVLLPYLADTGLTLLRRIVRGEDWRASHHEHFYQQLLERGWPHVRVALTVAIACALCGGLGLVSLGDDPRTRALADMVMIGVVVTYLALPSLIGRRDRAGRSLASPDPARE